MDQETGSKVLDCVDCGKPFVWSLGEQDYFKQHNLQQPKRCKNCRRARREERAAMEGR